AVFISGLAAFANSIFRTKLSNSIYFIFILTGWLNGIAFFPGWGDIFFISIANSPKLFVVAVIFVLLLNTINAQDWGRFIAGVCIGVLLYSNIAPMLLIA